MNLAHPLGVAAGQVVVGRDDVHALAFERVQIGGQGGDQRLAFAGLHLGNGAAVQDRAAHELHVEVPHVQHATSRFANDREGLRLQVAERLALGQPLAELVGLGAQLLVRKRLDGRLEGVNLLDERTQPFQFALVLGSDDFCEESTQHWGLFPRVIRRF